MEYTELSDEHKREILANNLLQLESEHYELAVRLEAYHGARDVSDENKAAMIEQTEARLGSLGAAIAVYRERLAAFNGAS